MTPIEISLLLAFLGFLMAGVVNVVIIARGWGKFTAILDQLNHAVAKLDNLVTALYERSESDRNRITKLETTMEVHRRQSSNGGGSYTVESPVYRCPKEG